MPNARGKSIDSTSLTIDGAEERILIHRDYLAHALRWSHACKVATRMRSDLWVLDIGCGREMPMAKMLYTNKIGASKYCGVDFSRFDVPEMLHGNGVFPVRLLRGADAATITQEQVSFRPNLVTCFEIFEHVEPRHGRAILANILSLMRDDGVLLFSTPCFNGDPAGNHVAEPEYEVMGATLEDAGFAVVDHWGTFASINDYVDHLYQKFGQPGLDLFHALKGYYDVNFLSVVFAPLFPGSARNCLWHCVKTDHFRRTTGTVYARRFPPRLEVKPQFSPTGSSSLDDDVLDQAMMDKYYPPPSLTGADPLPDAEANDLVGPVREGGEIPTLELSVHLMTIELFNSDSDPIEPDQISSE